MLEYPCNTDQIEGISRIPQCSSTQGSHGSSKAVSCQDKGVAWVSLLGKSNPWGQIVGHGVPGFVESVMGLAARTQITGICEASVQVCNPCCERPTASE